MYARQRARKNAGGVPSRVPEVLTEDIGSTLITRVQWTPPNPKCHGENHSIIFGFCKC